MSGLALGVAAFAVVLVTGVVWFRRALALRLPESVLAFIVAMATGLALAVAAFASGPGWIGGLAAGLAVFGSAFFLVTTAIGAQKGGSGVLRVGEPMPGFSAPDEQGQLFDLASLSGRPLLLKFFRGHW